MIRSEDPYAHYDLYSDDLFIEVKNRRVTTDQFIKYNEEGWILEGIKYRFLSDKNSRYINTFFIDNHKFILNWNIADIVPKFISKGCKSTTDFYNNSYKNKEVIMLKAENATIAYEMNGTFYRLTYEQLKRKLNG